MIKIFKHQIVEVIVPAGSTAVKFNIPDQPNLRNVNIQGIEFFTSEIVPLSIISGKALPTETELSKIYLTLQDYSGNEFNQQLPAVSLKNTQNAGTGNLERNFKNFTNQIVNFPKSYIQLPIALGNVTDVAVMFSVFFYDKNEAKHIVWAKKGQQ